MYRNIARLAPALVRGYSTQGSGAAPFAVSAFANQQAKFRALTEGSEKIPVPHDDAGFTKFASEYNALKAKVGVATPEERIFDTLAALRDSTDNVREYLARAAELRAGADIPDRNGAEAKLSAALAKVEAGLGGKPLLFSDEKGMTAFESELKAIESAVGASGSVDAAWAEAQKHEAAADVAALKAARSAALDRALAGSDISLADLK